MAVLTTGQVLIIGAIGGLAFLVGLLLFIVAGLALYALIMRALEWRERRRALRDGRRRLSTVRTIDDLKE